MDNFLLFILTIYHDVHFQRHPQQGRIDLRETFVAPLVYKNLLALTALAPGYGRWPWGTRFEKSAFGAASRSFFLAALGKIYQIHSQRSFLHENLNNLNRLVNNGVLSKEEADTLVALAREAVEYAYLECVPERYLRDLMVPECQGRTLEQAVADYISGCAPAKVVRSAVLACAHLWYFEHLKSELANHIREAAAEDALNEPSRILLRLLHPSLSPREVDLMCFALLVSFIGKYPQLFGSFNYRDPEFVKSNFNRCLFRACGHELASGENNANADIPRLVKLVPISPAQFRTNLAAEVWGTKSQDNVPAGSPDDDAAAARWAVEVIVSSFNPAVGRALRETLDELRAGHQTFARAVSGAITDAAEKQNGWHAYCFLADQAVARMHTHYEKFSRQQEIAIFDDATDGVSDAG